MLGNDDVEPMVCVTADGVHESGVQDIALVHESGVHESRSCTREI